MYCISCGHRNPEPAHFCARCGSSLSSSGDDTTISLVPEDIDVEEPSISVESLRAGQAVLVVKRGMSAGSTFLLDKDVTSAGRNPSSDIFLDDVTVSRRHAEILREGDRFVVKDAGSLNGTYVNRERVDVAELSGGDELQIGKFKLTFFAGGA